MKLYWKGAWLGYAVLLSFALFWMSGGFETKHPNGALMMLSGGLMWLWVIRATIRAIGRAWRHGAKLSS